MASDLASDYYAVLDVGRHATAQDINKAFRKLALKHHPDRHDGVEEAHAKLREVAEAFEVLSDKKTRALFDQYGDQGLKDGVPDGKGGLIGGTYRFSGDAQRIFENFFGAASPFADMYGELSDPTASAEDAGGPAFHGDLTSLAKPVEPQQPRPVLRVLPVTLSQLYCGATVTVAHARKRLNADGTTTRSETEELTVRIQPGWSSGYKVVFPKMGDEGPAVVPADVVYTLKETPGGDGYRRSGHDLIYTAKISLTDALCGIVLAVPTLDGRTLSVGLTEVVTPAYVHTVEGEGMPILSVGESAGGARKGNLLIEFDIQFPGKLTPKQRSNLKAVKM